MDKDKMNMNISDGDAFFAHQVSVNFSPTQMFLDFKSVTPRMDERSTTRPSVSLKHNLVMLDIHHAKQFYELLGRILGKYEEQVGAIERPKAIETLNKKRKEELAKMKKAAGKKGKDADDKSTASSDIPSYFG